MTELPFSAYRFKVTLSAGDAYLPPTQQQQLVKVAEAGFQEATGLGADLEVLSYREGGVNAFAHQLPVGHSWNRITLKRGVVRTMVLWEWYLAGLHHTLGARRDGTIHLISEAGQTVVCWTFHAGIAVKWSGPEFNALANAVAIESLEIAHHGLTLGDDTSRRTDR